jgi:hypothetical protein
MANLKDIVATLAILSAGTLTLTGCKKTEGETAKPEEVKADDSGGAGEGEASCSGDEGEASCSGGEGEGSCSGGEGEGSCSGAA